MHVLAGPDPSLRRRLRVSRYLEAWLADAQRRAARADARARFLAEVAAGRQTMDVLRHPLLPYQREGMLVSLGDAVCAAQCPSTQPHGRRWRHFNKAPADER